MGGRIKYLELELNKSEATKRSVVERLQLELRDTRRELEIQRKISDKYAQVGCGGRGGGLLFHNESYI